MKTTCLVGRLKVLSVGEQQTSNTAGQQETHPQKGTANVFHKREKPKGLSSGEREGMFFGIQLWQW